MLNFDVAIILFRERLIVLMALHGVRMLWIGMLEGYKQTFGPEGLQ